MKLKNSVLGKKLKLIKIPDQTFPSSHTKKFPTDKKVRVLPIPEVYNIPFS